MDSPKASQVEQLRQLLEALDKEAKVKDQLFDESRAKFEETQRKQEQAQIQSRIETEQITRMIETAQRIRQTNERTIKKLLAFLKANEEKPATVPIVPTPASIPEGTNAVR